jgi:crotonobetainyl-CoA:carnitine CoA-transferase CaiB-like acyl-CoA transferase
LSAPANARPLDGIRVIEVGPLHAGPVCGTKQADIGADHKKVEPPGSGDPIRGWRLLDAEGTAWWWQSLARNKRSVTANLRSAGGRDVVRRLIAGADVVIENFKPGTMEKWALGPAEFVATNPGLVYARISGYGQTGPYAHKPGYASVTEAFSGFRHVNGFPDGPPVRPNLSIGDTVSGIHAVLGILLALRAREHTGRGQVVDVALYESMFNLMEAVVPEYSGQGAVRGPSGTTITGIVPTNTYRCADGRFVVIGGNGDSIFVRLMSAIGRPDIGADPSCADNPGRVRNEAMIDAAIAEWTAANDADRVIAALEEADVPVGLIYSVEDMMRDPQYIARGLFETVRANGRDIAIPAILPRLDDTPGYTTSGGPAVGEHRDAILAEIGYSLADIERLTADGDV